MSVMRKETESREDWVGEHPGRLLTPAEVAVVLGVGARTVRRLTANGTIPCVNVGGRRPRYNLTEVLAALREATSTDIEENGHA